MDVRVVVVVSVVSAASVVLAPAAARGDGAFPDSDTIIVPLDRPNEILLGTNFGVVRSEDAGATWTWSCEQTLTTNARLYQLGPPPGHRLYAVALGKLVHSDDGACGWQSAGGAIGGQSVQDAFIDPGDASRAFAIGLAPAAGGGSVYTVFESDDGGASFDAVRYRGGPGELVLGVESARSDPSTVYLSLASPGGAPVLARSNDGGASWQKTNLSATLGAAQIRIVAVDPTDPGRLFLRAIGVSDEGLALVEGGGATVTRAVTFSRGALRAFVRTASGKILAGGLADGAAALYRSDDGGATFRPLPSPFGLRALAERGGVIYAATENATDGFLEATSSDDGATWQGGLASGGIGSVTACIRGACRGDCLTRAAAGQWPAGMCDADPPPPDPGASADGAPPANAMGGEDASTQIATATSSGTGGTSGAARASGCGCRVATGAAPGIRPGLLGMAALLAAMLFLGRPRRRR